jgi:hypothetical protein
VAAYADFDYDDFPSAQIGTYWHQAMESLTTGDMVTVDERGRVRKVDRDYRPEVTYTIPEETLMDYGGVVFEQKNGGVQGYLRTRRAALDYYYDVERRRDRNRQWAQRNINSLNYDEAQGRQHDMFKYPILDPAEAFARLVGRNVLGNSDYVASEPIEGDEVEQNSITITVDAMLREELQKQQFAEEVARKKALLADFGVDDFLPEATAEQQEERGLPDLPVRRAQGQGCVVPHEELARSGTVADAVGRSGHLAHRG